MTTSGKYIIYADDDQDDQELLTEVMHTVQPDIVINPVRNGIEVLEFLAGLDKGENYPALIVLDINMPMFGGYQTLKHLKLTPAFAHIPVVIFSTSNLLEDRKKSLRYGAIDYLTKPMYFHEAHRACQRFSELCEGLPLAVG